MMEFKQQCTMFLYVSIILSLFITLKLVQKLVIDKKNHSSSLVSSSTNSSSSYNKNSNGTTINVSCYDNGSRHDYYNITTTIDFNDSAITTPNISSSSSSICRVMGFHVLPKQNNDFVLTIPHRSNSERLYQNNYVCRENGNNMEVIISRSCAYHTNYNGIRIILRNVTASTRNIINHPNDSSISTKSLSSVLEKEEPVIYNATKYSYPYVVFDSNDVNISLLPVGSYRIAAYPINVQDNSTTFRGILRMMFHVVDCIRYQPKNECSQCPSSCVGSQCIETSPNGIRFTMLIYGQDIYDYGMNITSPLYSTISAYHNNTMTNANGTNDRTFDHITGGYVDIDYKETLCQSTGVWIKNIVYPHYTSGMYVVTIESVFQCLSASITNNHYNNHDPSDHSNTMITIPKNHNRYELRVYRHEKLISMASSSQFSDPTNITLTFTL